MKKELKAFLVTCIIFVSFSCIKSQNGFSPQFFGEYYGSLDIFAGVKKQQIEMEFHLLPTEKINYYQYNLIYVVNDSLRNERKYTLIFDENTQSYSIDENNGIVLSASWVDNVLYSLFEVQGGLLTSFLRFENDYVNFEITYAAKNKSLTTGGLSDEVPEVISYPISTVQRAKLIKR